MSKNQGEIRKTAAMTKQNAAPDKTANHKGSKYMQAPIKVMDRHNHNCSYLITSMQPMLLG
jgi:hypothetical protein